MVLDRPIWLLRNVNTICVGLDGVESGACPGIFHWRGKTEAPKADSEGGILGKGAAAPPPHQLGVLVGPMSSSSGVWSEAPTVERFSTIISTQDGLSCHYDIVNCGRSYSHWEPRPPCRHHRL